MKDSVADIADPKRSYLCAAELMGTAVLALAGLSLVIFTFGTVTPGSTTIPNDVSDGSSLRSSLAELVP